MQILDLQQGDYDDVYSNGTNASVDSAFRKIQKQSTAFLIWRIENMTIVALPKDQYGTFYDSDCYLIYSASQQGQLSGIDVIPRDIRGANLEYHIHFWLGSSTTADKSGVAAYKAVELDNYIGGLSVQHRETQGNESYRFKSYFKNGYKILCGLSGRNGDSNFKPKLYRVKGKRAPITTEIANVDWSNFSSKDVYVVHTERIIFIWVGRAASATEKLHAIKAAIQIKESNRNASIVFVDDGYEQTLSNQEKTELDKYLPLNKRALSKLHEDNEEEIEKQKTIIRLYRCSDNNGKYRVAEVKLNPLQQTDLDSEDVFILDHGVHGIWVWVGKKANDKERTEALRNARGFVKKKKYPNNTKVTRVVEGFEPLEFKVLFLRWKNTTENGRCFTKTQSGTKGAKIALTKFDATFMNDRLALAAETQLVDDGSGSLQIWRIKKADAVEIPNEQYGTFYSAECYVILYSYEVNQEKKHVLYSWVGMQTTESEMEWALTKMIELNKDIGGKATLTRLFQEHESAHFLQLFKGKMIVFKGSWSDHGIDRNTKNATYLLKIRGTTTYSSQAIQVHCKAASLNSNCCFVLRRGKRSYVWCGNNSTGDQREMAKGFVGKDCELILEGKEREQFWDYLGGKTQYANDKVMTQEEECRLPRMMYCSRRDGVLETEEVFGYQQSDLMPEELVVFDAYQTVYAWVGKMYMQKDPKVVLNIVEEYLVMDPAGRNIQIPILVIQQDNEPPTFKGYFESWDNKFWQEYRSFEQIRLKIEGKSGLNIKETNGVKTESNGNFDQYEKYPLHILKASSEKLPAKIDPLKKELYLTHDDFVSLFKMKYSEFDGLPRWKQQELKKKVGLF